MKPAKRRRIDVNLDELDRVLDGARQTPLSEADCDKLKSALHALAAMLPPRRNTEKTGALLEEEEDLGTGEGTQPDPNASPQPGHGRNGAKAFGGARTVEIAHQDLTHGDRCPGCGKGNVYGQKEPKVLVRIVGHGRRQFVEVVQSFPEECRHVLRCWARCTVTMRRRARAG